MKLSDLNKAISVTEAAQKAVAVVYGQMYANNLFSAALNQLKHSYQHIESNKKYEGMSDEEVDSLKKAERDAEIEAAQLEMKARLELAYKVPVPPEKEELVEDTADSDDVRPEPKI